MSDSGKAEGPIGEKISPSSHSHETDSESSLTNSDDSAGTHGPAPERIVSEEKEKKRMADGEARGQLKAKRVKVFASDRYRELYNSTIEGHYHSPDSNHGDPLMPCQLGSTLWSLAEKELFFHLLARKGRHDLKSIAAEIRSKSEPEIALYIEILSKGLIDSELSFVRPSFVGKPASSAAFEIGSKCIEALDRAPTALTISQREQEVKIEKKRRGDLWLLTPKIGKWAGQCFRNGQDDQSQLSKTIPAAIILDLDQLLRLSKHYFMNSSDLEYNWRSYADEIPKAPKIMNTAFSDLHTLTLDITKRLVQSTLHIAMSRLKAKEIYNYRPTRVVWQHDVYAAIGILGMRANGSSHWTGVARRCKLRVFESVKYDEPSDKCYSYDEVEDILMEDNTFENKGPEADAADEEGTNDSDDTKSNPTRGSDSETDIENTDESGSSEHSPSVQHDEEPLGREEQVELRQEEYLDSQDQRHSRAEEKRLWKLLGATPPRKLNLNANMGKPKNQPITTRKDRAELVDWTSWTDYGAEWETLESPVPTEAFEDNHQTD